ncbi:MAG TPA: hypothetical protein VIX84_14240 [Acidimicrobiales bacterium]
MSEPTTIDLEDLGLDRGAGVLLDRALASLAPGERLTVRGRHPELAIQLRAWCRGRGHRLERDGVTVVRGDADRSRWHDATRASGGPPDLAARADARWGLAARGALVESGGPTPRFDLDGRDLVWADAVPRLYAQALASQWDPATAIDWAAADPLAPELEAAVVQVMTFLVENETAALVVPARFLGRIHPYFQEVLQLLAVQVADEARHIEVFTRRARLRGATLGVSGAGGRASLQTLLDEPDFALASFLLSVLGEGSFLNLLAFLDRHAPDPVTARVAHLALQDEARHVAYGVAHLEHQLAADPGLRSRLRAAVQRRHDAIAETAGLNEQVFDALVVLAAGAWTPAAIGRGHALVAGLQDEMDDGRRGRLARLGFDEHEAAELSALHTRNFM